MKKTKIVATISDLKCDVDFLQKLYDLGVNVFRVNTAHQQPTDTLKVMDAIKQVSEKAAIMVDIKGPEIRTRNLPEKFIAQAGNTLAIKAWDETSKSSPETLYVSYKGFVQDLEIGMEILIDDGEVALKVENKTEDSLTCKVLNEGEIGNNKSVNVPGAKLKLPSLSEKDKIYVDFCCEHNVDFIAHSFVRSKEDVLPIQQRFDELGNKTTKIVAKIENQEGVDNIEEILDHVYTIVIARGDLAIEIPAREVPVAQRKMIEACQKKEKPVITATQMLHTMIKNPRPTRAEVNDIASAVYLGSDCVMLSGETAYGDYPIEAVTVMANTLTHIESQKQTPTMECANNTKITNFLAKSIVEATQKLPVKAIIADTIQGATIRRIAKYKPRTPIFTFCYSKETMRRMAMSYGAYAYYTEKKGSVTEFMKHAVQALIDDGKITAEDMVATLAGHAAPGQGPCFIDISKAEDILKR